MNSYSGRPQYSAALAGSGSTRWLHALHQTTILALAAQRYGADTAVRDWHKRLICSRCGGREVDFVLTGARR